MAIPTGSDASDVMIDTDRNIFPSRENLIQNLEQVLSEIENYENIRQHIYNKVSKRRAQAKANLAGLWGVPTRFA